jgi:GMP synthase-like glutamine amidotransferase
MSWPPGRRLYARPVAVELVFTERRRDLTASRARNFARLRARLAEASGEEVATSHYEVVDPGRLARASAVVLSGSTAAWSERDEDELLRLGEALTSSARPVLGICAGMQLQARFAGGSIGPSVRAERGFQPITVLDDGDLLRGMPRVAEVFQDHSDEITRLPEGFRVLAESPDCGVQAISCPDRRWWGTQFHPEEWTSEHPDSGRVLRTFFELA